MTTLADEVLPLIRTRHDLHRYSAANRHGIQMHEAVDILESAIPDEDPSEVHAVVEKALASALRVIWRADDSSGIIGDACRRLITLHSTTAAASGIAPRRLVDWMMKFQFENEVDYFTIDPVAYAPALGDAGVAAYRSRIEDMRNRVGPDPAEWSPEDPHRHTRVVVQHNECRLAVLDHDIDAIIRTHTKDRKVARWLHDTAKAFEEIGEYDLAIDWARQAADHGPGHQSQQAAGYWCELLGQHRPADVVAARFDVFRRWPSSSTAAHLFAATGDDWPKHRREVMDTLASRPAEAVSFALFALKDPGLAWKLADGLSLDNDIVWAELAKAYQKVDPLATLAIHQRLVEDELVEAGAQHYRRAARRLATMRRLAAGTDEAATVEQLIASLRETHRRRPRLQQEFDRAGLP